MAVPKRSSLGTPLPMNFLTYHGINILEFATTVEHNKRKNFGGRSEWLWTCINMKYVGEGTSAAKNSGYFPSCSAAVMLKVKARSVCTRTRGCSSAQQQIRAKKSLLSYY